MRGGWGFKNHEESDGKAVAMETEQGYNGGANAGSSSDSDVSWNNSSPGSPVDCGEVSPGGYSSGVDLGTVSSCSSPGGSAGSGDTTGAGRRINLMLRFNLPMAFWDDSGENLSMENNTSSSPVSSKESLSRSVSEPNIVHSSSGNDSGNDGSVESFERSFLRKKSLASKIQARLSQAEARPALISRFVFADEDIEKVKKRVRVVKSLNFYEHVRPAIDGSPDQNRRMYMDISMDESGQY
ncbi:uncharacterized protein LOC142342047 [Convolutriloba macropyga]|uniref:uncharacterized protein LOC142342047 n=1 Tax=Convolutriloba macropyga TaxID=536237 RepID=UPI003F522B91